MMNFYGDNIRWFLGTVVDINDPFEMGRVRVRIHGLHTDNTDDIPTSDLPYAQVVADIRQGGVSGIGSNIGIKENAQVFGIFLDGKNSQVPLVLGSLTKIEGTPSYELKQLVEENADSIARLNDRVNVISNSVSSREKHTVEADRETFPTAESNIEKAFLFLKSGEAGLIGDDQNRGAIVSGIVGNLIVESGFAGKFRVVDSSDPTKDFEVDRPGRIDIHPDIINVKEGSVGIAQWNPSKNAGFRLMELQKFSNERNLPATSLRAQLLFIKHELFKYRWMGLDQGLLGVSSGIDGAEEACRIFEEYYERPQAGSTDKRLSRARECFNTYENFTRRTS